jgi:hypothetical protein
LCGKTDSGMVNEIRAEGSYFTTLHSFVLEFSDSPGWFSEGIETRHDTP